MSAPGREGYQVRVHPRARSVKIRVDPHGSVVVTVPPRFDARRLPEILLSNRDWILARQEAARTRRDAETGRLPGGLPEAIALTALGRCVPVRWQPDGSSSTARLREEGGRLIVSGDLRSAERCKRLLRGWVLRQARECLPCWLARVAEETGLSYARCSVNAARSRWGSCSRDGRINLSARLLFLPERMVRHVMIHELCHTLVPAHSASFWALVARFDADFRAARAGLRRAGALVPLWMEKGQDSPAFVDGSGGL